MVYGAIKGLVSSLGDPYSFFMDPEEAKMFLEDMQGSFEGIGAEVGIRDGILTVIAPLEGMPAQKAGLEAGDKIIKIENTLTADLTLTEAVRLIRGPKGTPVTLTIIRDSQSKEVTITRAKIDIPSVKWEMKQGNIAYIDLDQFDRDTPKEFSRVAKEVIKSQAKGIILDLRNNPGGYLDVAVDVAGWFLSSGDIVAIEDFGNGKKVEHRCFGKSRLKDYPLVVLVNKGSASGSEILAGALRDHRGVKLIGERTFGKGSVQELEELKDSSSLRISIARWLTPKGTLIEKKGLEPDISVSDPEAQIQEALKILR
jgi:carboxyl-terminal processing protease